METGGFTAVHGAPLLLDCSLQNITPRKLTLSMVDTQRNVDLSHSKLKEKYRFSEETPKMSQVLIMGPATALVVFQCGRVLVCSGMRILLPRLAPTYNFIARHSSVKDTPIHVQKK